jgi:hypothetical protein
MFLFNSDINRVGFFRKWIPDGVVGGLTATLISNFFDLKKVRAIEELNNFKINKNQIKS